MGDRRDLKSARSVAGWESAYAYRWMTGTTIPGRILHTPGVLQAHHRFNMHRRRTPESSDGREK